MKHFFWVLLLILLVFRFFSTRPDYKEGDRVRISSKVTSEPVRYSDAQGITLEGLRFYLPYYPQIYYGDKIVVEGEVEDVKLKDPYLVSVEPSKSLLPKIRKRIVGFYHASIPEPHSSLVAGMTLGSKASIPQHFWELLKKSGTAHVVVASGMNVTLVASFLMTLLVAVVPRRKAVIFALAGIWLYALISGFDAPIIRAAIMGSIAFSALVLGRLNYAWRGLFLSAYLMLIIKPDWIKDLGFILSFVATASLMLFEKRVRKIVSFVPGIFREGLSTSLAAQIGVAPILYYTFNSFNILSPVINALVLWTVSPITVIGMISALLSYISIYLGRLVLYLVYPLTWWFEFVVIQAG
ncbi:MAG: ComEC/Rec2 family competence protein [Candidatus Woesebacteria bacterium]|jgi:competence protein ComEC